MSSSMHWSHLQHPHSFSPSPYGTGFSFRNGRPEKQNGEYYCRFHQLAGVWKHPNERYPYEGRKAISAPKERCRVGRLRKPLTIGSRVGACREGYCTELQTNYPGKSIRDARGRTFHQKIRD